MSTRLEQLGRPHVDAFLHVGVADSKRSRLGGLAYRCAASSNATAWLTRIVSVLLPVWWRVDDALERHLGPSFEPCAGRANGTHRACVAEDAGLQNRGVGCYADAGRACSYCDTSKYFQQFGRLLASYHAVAAREAACQIRYAWLMRLRTDLLGAPPGRFEVWPVYRARLEASTLYTGKRQTHGTHPDAWAPADQFALVPRALADGYFSLALRFLQCQDRRLNARVCGHTWDWATPECIYKVHLARCIGLAHVATSHGASTVGLLRGFVV